MDLCLRAVWLGAGISFAHGIAVVLWRLCSLQPCFNCIYLPDQARSCDFLCLLFYVLLFYVFPLSLVLVSVSFTGNALGMILW